MLAIQELGHHCDIIGSQKKKSETVCSFRFIDSKNCEKNEWPLFKSALLHVLYTAADQHQLFVLVVNGYFFNAEYLLIV